MTIVKRGQVGAPANPHLSDYVGLEAQRERNKRFLQNPKTIFEASYWANRKNLGILGYWQDKLDYAKSRKGGHSFRGINQLDADEAESLLTFPPGHPLYETVYAGHPLVPPVYVPVAGFHPFLFQEKVNELMALFASLGAVEVDVRYIRGYSHAFALSASAEIDTQIPLGMENNASFQRYMSTDSKMMLRARFTPQGRPRLPEKTVWYEHEPTWMRVAQARLGEGLREIDVELRYDDDFGVGAKLALQLAGCGLGIGGEFHKHESTAWGFRAQFG